MVEGDAGHQIEQAAQLVGVELQAGKILVEDVLEPNGIIVLNGLHGSVDENIQAFESFRRAVGQRDFLAGCHLGILAQKLPARPRRHPEDVFLGVVVAHLQLGIQRLRREVFAQKVVAVRVRELLFQLGPAVLKGV